MIIGLILIYIKTYQRINYIPITNLENFCGLIGDNGIGKTSILESLDCFFNNREWNLHVSIRRSGLSTTNPSIIPIFLIEKNNVKAGLRDSFEKLSTLAWDIEEADTALSNKPFLKEFY